MSGTAGLRQTDAGHWDPSLLPYYGWGVLNSQSRTWPVATSKPNDLGLFDMLGNVIEWCHDRYEPRRDPSITVRDDQPASEQLANSHDRVLRGVSIISLPAELRSAWVNNTRPNLPSDDVEFRVARTYA